MTTRRADRPAKDVRLVLVSAAVDSFGSGLWLAGGALFFHQALGLPLAAIGAGLAVAGLVALPAGVQLARFADRHGPRGSYVLLTLIQAACYAAFVFAHSFPLFVVLATLGASLGSGAQAVRSGIVRGVGGEAAVRLRARLHAIMNVAIALGAAAAGVLIAFNTTLSYDLLILTDAVTFAVAGGLLHFIEAVPVSGGPAARGWVAIRDRGYVAAAALDGVMDLEFGISGYILPLWVVTHTAAPRWFASVLLLLNTAIVALFQVRFSKGAERPPGAARSFRAAGFVLALAAGAFALTGVLSPLLAILGLLVAMAVHSVGELLHASGQFGLSYGLAPEGAVSEYQAVFSLGMGFSRAFAPAVLTFLCILGGSAGWLVVGLVFVGAGVAMPILTRHVLERPEKAVAAAVS